MLLLHPLVGAEGLRLLAVVLDEDQLEIRVGGAVIDGLDAEFEVLDVVAGGDQDADPVRMSDGVIGLVIAGRAGDEADLVHRDAAAGIMGLEGRDARVDAVGLGGDVRRRAAGAGAPVIEGVGDVDDLRGLFGQAEEEVVILTAVVLHPLAAAAALHQGAAESGQVADVVVGAEVVQHEVRFEVVEHHVVHAALEGGFVGVDEVCPLLGDGLGRVPERTGVEDIVMVQQGDVIAGGHLDAVVGVAGDELVLFELLVADAGVRLGAVLYLLAHGGVLPGVHAAKLPVLVGLVLDGIQQLFKERQRSVVERHHDADLRGSGLGIELLHQQLHGGKGIRPQGLAGEEGGVLAAGAGLFPHPGNTLGPQLVQEDEERQGVPELAALADDIAGGPRQFPEGRACDLAEGLFQLLFMAAAQGKVAAEPFNEGGLFAAAPFGPHHPVPQGVQFLLVALDHGQSAGLGGPEEGRLLGAALAAPEHIAVVAALGQLLGPVGQSGGVGADQQHLRGQLYGQFHEGGVLHHQQVGLPGRRSRPLVCPDARLAQGLLQRSAGGFIVPQHSR